MPAREMAGRGASPGAATLEEVGGDRPEVGWLRKPCSQPRCGDLTFLDMALMRSRVCFRLYAVVVGSGKGTAVIVLLYLYIYI